MCAINIKITEVPLRRPSIKQIVVTTNELLQGNVGPVIIFIYSNCILHPCGSSNYNTKACKHIKKSANIIYM